MGETELLLITGAAGATVSTVTLRAADAALVVPDTVSVAVKLCAPFARVPVSEAPGPAAVRRRRAEQRRTVVDIHRAACRCRASQRQRVVVGNVVTRPTPLSVENDAMVGAGAFNVTFTDEEAAPVLPAASVSFAVKLWLPARQGGGRITPGPACIRGRRAKLRRPVEHRHRAVGLGRAAQGNDVGGRDGVATNHRRRRRHRIDRHAQRRRRRTGGAGHRIRRGETMRPVR